MVKSRLDRCLKIQPDNPVALKLRADWCMRFGPQLADTDQCMRDLKKAGGAERWGATGCQSSSTFSLILIALQAIKLCDADPEGATLTVHAIGFDPKEQRSYLLACCHYKLAGFMQRK